MKLYYSVIFLFLFSFSSFAQDTTKTCNALKHGIQFQVGSVLTIENFNGYTFSYRYNFNKNSGLRIGFYTSLNNTEYNLTQKSDSTSINPPEYNKGYTFKISTQYLYSVMSSNNFSLTIGGGPFVTFGKNDSYSEYLYNNNTIRKYSEYQKRTGYGLDILAGINYQLFTNIVLSGEYGLSITRESGDIKNESSLESLDHTQNQIYRENGTVKVTSLRSMYANLGIAIFF